MVGYASTLGGDVAEFPAQVADLTMEMVDQFAVAASGDQTAIVTKGGEPAVINSHGQAVPVNSEAGILARVHAMGIPTWGILAAVAAGWYFWTKR